MKVQENITVIRSCLLPRRRGSFTREDHVGFVVDKVVGLTGADFLRLLRFSPVSIIPPMLNNHF